MGEPPGWFAAESPSRGVIAACSTDTLRGVHRRHVRIFLAKSSPAELGGVDPPISFAITRRWR